MKKGDIYEKHVLGSRFNFDREFVFYKSSNGSISYATNDVSGLIDDLIDVKGDIGTFRINEEGIITTFCKGIDAYYPKFVCKLKEELVFDEIDNNPKGLEPGNFWTGFNKKHGSKFFIDADLNLRFREKHPTEKTYLVECSDSNLINRLLSLKGETGRICINEYQQIWAPVKLSVIQDGHSITNIDCLTNHFNSLTHKQKRLIQSYINSFDREKTKGETWCPIYLGKLTGSLTAVRPNVVSRIPIYDMDEDD